jgi:hypothetical protein
VSSTEILLNNRLQGKKFRCGALGPEAGDARGVQVGRCAKPPGPSMVLVSAVCKSLDAEQEAFLRSHACDEMQGFLFSKPLPAIHLAELLKPKPCWLRRRCSPRSHHGRITLAPDARRELC